MQLDWHNGTINGVSSRVYNIVAEDSEEATKKNPNDLRAKILRAAADEELTDKNFLLKMLTSQVAVGRWSFGEFVLALFAVLSRYLDWPSTS